MIATIIIAGIIAFAAGLAIAKRVRDVKNHNYCGSCGGCNGNCGSCRRIFLNYYK